MAEYLREEEERCVICKQWFNSETRHLNISKLGALFASSVQRHKKGLFVLGCNGKETDRDTSRDRGRELVINQK